MGIQKCGLNLDLTKKELLPHGTFEFPCAGYLEHYNQQPNDNIPWHWHNELEVIYLSSGKLKIQVPGRAYLLSEGDCFLINSGILHCAAAQSGCELHSIVFSPLLLTGSNDSVFAKKYIHPLTQCSAFSACLLEPAANRREIEEVNQAFDALLHDSPGFEFTVREKLSALCYAVYRQFESSIAGGETPVSLDNQRLRDMM